MSHSTFPSVAVPLVENCFICSSEINPFSENKNKPHRQFSEFAKNNGKVCELFCRIACRYLNFKCGDIKPEETISVSDSNDDDDDNDNKKLLCENCFPLANSLCEIYREFKYFEQLFRWKMKEVIHLIQAQTEKLDDKNDKNWETPENQRCDKNDFGGSFIKRGNENLVVNDFPKLQLPRVKKLCQKQLPNHSKENSQLPVVNEIQISKIVSEQEKEIEAARSDFNLNVTTETEAPNFKCRICLKSFASPQFLETHERTVHRGDGTIYKCEVCGKMYTKKNSLSKHMLLHSGTIHRCLVCHKEFRHPWCLRVHQKRNNCNRNVTKAMKNATTMKFETTEETIGKKNCKFCGKSIVSRCLKRHERLHMGIKPYKCQVCGKAFSVKANLTIHERIHSGAKPYQCGICGMKFISCSDLKKHGDRKHPGEEFNLRKRKDFSVKCGFCDKVFTQFRDKANHERSHIIKEQHSVNAVINNVARDEGDIQIVKVDISDITLEYNNEGIDHHDEDKFILPD